MVVRFEVDAQVATAPIRSRDIPGGPDDLSEALAGLSFSCRTPAHEAPPPAPHRTSPDNLDAIVTVVRGGTRIPQSSIIEISTRSTKSAQRQNWETDTQLFLSQTPVHYLAVHQRGVFNTVTTRPLNSPQFQRIAAQDGSK